MGKEILTFGSIKIEKINFTAIRFFLVNKTIILYWLLV